MKRASELWTNRSDQRFLYFGCSGIDALVGGIPCAGITEIHGCAGSGKTQICMSLAVQTSAEYVSKAVDGDQSRVAYLSCGEGEFPIKRLQQIVHNRKIKLETSQGADLDEDRILSCILIQCCYNINDLESSLFNGIPKLCRSSPIKLIVIDSIAGAMNTEFDTSTLQQTNQRTAYLFKISTQLKWLADTFNLAVVVINQVRSTGFDSAVASNSSISPALGLTWSHCINTRISVSRSHSFLTSSAIGDIGDEENNDSNSHAANISSKDQSSSSDMKEQEMHIPVHVSKRPARRISLQRSPWRASGSCGFEITASGIEDIN